MKKIKKYYYNFIYSPNLLKYLKIDEKHLILQILDCLGHATTPVFPPVIAVWILFMWNDVISRQFALIILIISILIWFLMTCILIYEHKLFNNFKKFDKDKKKMSPSDNIIITGLNSNSNIKEKWTDLSVKNNAVEKKQ